jgi:stage V sporulation protein AF
MEKKKLSAKLEENLKYIRERLGVDVSFDIIVREMEVGGRKAAFIVVDAFADSDVITLILQNLVRLKREDLLPNPLEKIFRVHIPYMEMQKSQDLDEIIDQVLAGPMAFLLDGQEEAIILDVRNYPARNPEEPEIERITRGSRDGFVETLIFNVGLIRRRLRDPSLRTEHFSVGTRSKTDICLLYLNDIANPQIVATVRERLEKIKVDGLPMAEKSVEEFITEGYYNPYPQVRYTERPDVAAIHLLEGHVIILVDTSPAAMIAPVTFFHHIQHAEEYRQNVPNGLYLRAVRFLGIIISVILAPLWLLLATNRQLLPPFLEFIGPQDMGTIPLFIQFLIANFGVDLIRVASIHTPSALATALGLIGALLIGDIAVQVGIFTNEVLLYISLVAVGLFTTPSWELSLANRFSHLLMLLATGLFHLYGFLGGLLLIFILLARTRSFGLPYLWPLFPLNIRALIDVIIRKPVPSLTNRPSLLRPGDPDRLPPREDRGK